MASTPLFTVKCARILSPPGAWEYSNSRRSRGVIAFRLSVVLTEPPFYGRKYHCPDCCHGEKSSTSFSDFFGYRSRSAYRSLSRKRIFAKKVLAAYLRLARYSRFVFEYRIFNFQRTGGSAFSVFASPTAYPFFAPFGYRPKS